jgi:hypothetical protein
LVMTLVSQVINGTPFNYLVVVPMMNHVYVLKY